MNIFQIAKESGFTKVSWEDGTPYKFHADKFEAFAQAISAKAIEDYKASLIPEYQDFSGYDANTTNLISQGR